MPLNYFPTGQQPGHRECHVVNGANPPRSVLVPGTSVQAMGGQTSVQTQQYVNTALGLHANNLRGTVHSWRYLNGDVRYTFQPSR